MPILFTLTAALFPGSASGQQAGHYIEAATGLENGSAPPPGIFVNYMAIANPINSIKGPNGNTIARPDIDLVAHFMGYAVTTDKKILGANYGLMFLVPAVNTRFTSTLFDASAEAAGVSDVFFAPIVLGWEKGNANYILNYGFYAPSGNFNPALPLNPGLGFWEHQVQGGMTYSLDKKKLWNTSVLTTWEINMSKTGLDVKPGPMFTAEYSFGRRFFKYAGNIGAVGAAYKKLSPDSGSGINPLVAGLTDRSFSAGGEIKFTDPFVHLGFDFRFEQQFGVESKTSGQLFVIGITFLDLLHPPPRPPKK
ncbi:MAG TPA: transporter [Edaphobacter sp.]|nr:transporter [Edaphobacter sp.]